MPLSRPTSHKACSHNPRPHSMLAELGGSVLNSAECSKDMVEAFASLYAYNDGACYADGSIDVQSLKYIDDPNNALSYFERNDKEHSFNGSVFCNLESNTIILSFRGSADLYQPQSQNWYPDWETNVVAHLGPLPMHINTRSTRQIKSKRGGEAVLSIMFADRGSLVSCLLGIRKGELKPNSLQLDWSCQRLCSTPIGLIRAISAQFRHQISPR